MVQYFIAFVLTLTTLFADIYIVSLKVQVKNAQLINSSLMASLAMSEAPQKQTYPLSIILSKTCSKDKFFKCYESEITEYLMHYKSRIQAFSTNRSWQNENFSELVVPPTYLQVEFKDTLAKIAILLPK